MTQHKVEIGEKKSRNANWEGNNRYPKYFAFVDYILHKQTLLRIIFPYYTNFNITQMFGQRKNRAAQ